MLESTHLNEIISNLGIAIDIKNKQEILFKFAIKYDKKNKKYFISKEYDISHQNFGTLIADFLHTDFTNKSEFMNFFNDYNLLLTNYLEALTIKNKGISEAEYNTFINTMFNTYAKLLIQIQKDIDMVLSYCIYSPNRNTKNLTPFDRLCVLEAIPVSKPDILYSNKIELLTLNTTFGTENYTEENLCRLISKGKVCTFSNQLFLPKNINSLIYFELVEIMKNNIFLKSCKLCSKYFIAPSLKIDYCNNIAPGYKSKTCSEVGKNRTFMKNIDKDNALSLYMKIYRNKAYKASRNKDIEKYTIDYEIFKEVAKVKVKAYKNNKLSQKDFINWLNRNK